MITAVQLINILLVQVVNNTQLVDHPYVPVLLEGVAAILAQAQLAVLLRLPV
ncbi:hypothetical protein ACFL6S_07780 [Candidatus Poribacteria bacterium]